MTRLLFQDAAQVVNRSHLSRALGLAESLEHPIVPLPNGARAVASEIVVLLRAVLEAERA